VGIALRVVLSRINGPGLHGSSHSGEEITREPRESEHFETETDEAESHRQTDSNGKRLAIESRGFLHVHMLIDGSFSRTQVVSFGNRPAIIDSSPIKMAARQ
jgi:hypothetical protein